MAVSRFSLTNQLLHRFQITYTDQRYQHISQEEPKVVVQLAHIKTPNDEQKDHLNGYIHQEEDPFHCGIMFVRVLV
jgi:Mg2+/Co2+ transporter CorB